MPLRVVWDPMLSLFTRQTTGLSFMHGGVGAALATQRGTTLVLRKHVESAAPEDVTGMPDREKVVAALRSIKKSRMPLTRCVALLPSNRVYTQLATLSPLAKKNIAAHMHGIIASTIPEPFQSLHTLEQTLREYPDRIEVAVAAVRRDVLDAYKAACSETGVGISALTTPAAAIAGILPKKHPSFLLLHASAEEVTVSLVHHGWPVDEDVMPTGTSLDALSRSVESMATEYRGKGLVLDTLYVAGGSFEAMPQASSLGIERVFPDFQEGSWLAAACASVVRPSDLAINFVS
ncbi:hypothetical protein HYZ99_04160 [Candidatus Peregrinibacteria bacterium]|nr:hypothetical protein [Candidatus Peregrinibacteria bacterium]